MQREDLRRLENFALTFSELKEHVLGNEHVIPYEGLNELIPLITRDEMSMMMINFTFAYYGLKHELPNPKQEEDALNSMKELLGWELERNKRFVRSYHYIGLGKKCEEAGDFKMALVHFKKTLEVDESNLLIYYNLSELCRKQRDLVGSEKYRKMGLKFLTSDILPDMSPKEHFERLFRLFQQKLKVIAQIPKKYSKYFDDPIDETNTLFAMKMFMEACVDFLEGNANQSPKILAEFIDVLIDAYFEWISLIAGLTYFHLKDAVGTPEEVGELLDAIKNMLGMEEYASLWELKEQLKHAHPSTFNKEEVDGIDFGFEDGDDEEELFTPHPLDENRIEILVKTDGFGNLPVDVMAYEEEDIKSKVLNPEEIVIRDEDISIVFTYPLSTKAIFSHHSAGGFSRMDLFRCIYEGYKKIYDTEVAEVADPGTGKRVLNRKRSFGSYGIWGHYLEELVIEGIQYNPKKKMVSMFIGS